MTKFRFDELFDPTGRTQAAAHEYLKGKDSELLDVGTTPSSEIDATHETDEYRQMSDQLMRIFKMGWRNDMRIDGHALETIARIAQRLQNMSEVSESLELNDIIKKAGIKTDDED